MCALYRPKLYPLEPQIWGGLTRPWCRGTIQPMPKTRLYVDVPITLYEAVERHRGTTSRSAFAAAAIASCVDALERGVSFSEVGGTPEPQREVPVETPAEVTKEPQVYRPYEKPFKPLPKK